MSAIPYIKHSKLGRGLDESEIKKLNEIIKTRKLEKNEILFEETSESDALIIVKKGRIKLKRNTGRGTVEFGIVKEGEYFGELALGRRSSRLLTAEAVEPSEVFYIDSHDFEEFSKREPIIACKILKNALAIFAEKLSEFTESLIREGEL